MVIASYKGLRLNGSGCRVFRWNGEALVSDGEVWPTSTLYARCDQCTEVPGADHDCGIHARDTMIWIIGQVGEHIPGYIDLFGRVIRLGDHYRAQAARITEVHVEMPHEVALQIEARYPDVDVIHGVCAPPDGPPCEYWRTAHTE